MEQFCQSWIARLTRQLIYIRTYIITESGEVLPTEDDFALSEREKVSIDGRFSTLTVRAKLSIIRSFTAS